MGASGVLQQRGLTHRDYDVLLLALLAERDDYGYSLLRRLQMFCDAHALDVSAGSRQRVYQTLDRLEQAGAIVTTAPRVSRDVRQPRTIYRIAPPGDEMLRAFVAEPITEEPTRLEVLVRLACATATDAPALDALLRQWEEDCLRRLEQLGPPEAPGSTSSTVASVARALAASASRWMLDGQLQWLTDARSRLQRMTTDADRRQPERRS